MTSNSNRIIINTAAMYIKMLLSLFITFFTTRIILHNLGVTNYGVYNLVAGAVSMLGFVNGSMSNTVQRFLAYEMGANEEDRLKRTFSLSISIHLVAAVLVSVLLEALMPLFFNYIFNLPAESFSSAKISYHMVVIITFITIITTPYSACFNAHEHIAMQAVIDFIIVVLKLVAAFLLGLSSRDKLVVYVFWLLIIQILCFVIKLIYCKYLYKECKNVSVFRIDRAILNKMSSFIGWNMLESFSWLAKGQGIAILMNTFYGTAVNAAYGIGSQVDGQLRFFSSTLLSSFQPQIYKLGGARDVPNMLNLTVTATKASFFMLLIMFCPFVFVANDVLQWWLVDVPAYTERICLLLIFITLINFMSNGVNIAVLGFGDIKRYQIISSIIILISIPVGYAMYAMSDDVYLLLYVMVVVEIISNLVKYLVASNTMKVDALFFYKRVFFPCVLCLILCFAGAYVIDYFTDLINSQILGIFIKILFDCIWCFIIVFVFGLSASEKDFLVSKIIGLRNKIIGC